MTLTKIGAFDEMKIAGRILQPFRHPPPIDAVSVDDDAALDRLAEHFGEPHHGHGGRPNDVSKHLSGTDGRQLVNVANEDQRRLVRHRLKWALPRRSRLRSRSPNWLKQNSG